MLRRVLIVGTVAAVLVCGGAVAFGGWMWQRTALSTAGKIDFSRPLAVPPLAHSHIDAEGRRVFDLTARPGRHRLLCWPGGDVGVQRGITSGRPCARPEASRSS